ncbi:hypothetical protein CAEBREN_17030 [Caenorhabditis brenneri]|uniref:Uncharacterized protein n=1 Tax=Caenorhabditis brenneri TaxID=135651 RepID=G0NRC7_CAEBE|nr:hypothetical protein CAEBREN_17030 [Caenorhabditis brenneri]
MKLLVLISLLALFTVSLAFMDPIISGREAGGKWRSGPFAKNNLLRFRRGNGNGNANGSGKSDGSGRKIKYGHGDGNGNGNANGSGDGTGRGRK